MTARGSGLGNLGLNPPHPSIGVVAGGGSTVEVTDIEAGVKSDSFLSSLDLSKYRTPCAIVTSVLLLLGGITALTVYLINDATAEMGSGDAGSGS